jgi:hypothetical protein
MIRGTFFAISLLASTSAHAGIYFYSGNEMWDYCSSVPGSWNRTFCVAYVAGINDRDALLGLPPVYCAPAGTRIDQLADVAENYLRDHPENRQQEAAILILQSFQAAWPCP